MKLDEEGLYSLALESVALEIAERTPGDLILDAFCGLGGSAIGFARAGKSVVSIEKDQSRLEMAKYNASLFEVSDRIEFINGDSLELLTTLKADTIFLDPPWGGVDYNKREKFQLTDFEPDGTILLKLAFSITDSVVIRLPKNFDFSELQSFGRNYELEDNTLDKKLLHYCVYFK
ncbi:MAG: hypothetical protein DHS20C13_13650 [Thermodesulfobacteriota bacterium]|nr:MAG: hypothetical protein DHS20C13_13650 [Thermodesulfobacteriota bacterium]